MATKIGLAFLRLLGRLPQGWRRGVGALFGTVVRLLGVRRRIVARNLQLAFPQMDEKTREQIMQKHFSMLGSVLMDELTLSGMSEQSLRQWIDFPDEEALRASPPTIICVPHFLAMTSGGVRLSAALAGRLAFHYKPLHSRFWDSFYAVLRQRYGAVGISAIAPGAMRSCAKFLREGGFLFYLPDTDGKHRKSTVFTPFLGVQAAATTTALSRLATWGNAQVRVFVPLQTANGYALHLSPPLENFPSNDAAEDARRINAIIGEYVRAHPAQYYWLHRRFKTRPPEELEDRYGKN